MKENMEERAERLALYIIENQTTVRAAAQKFGISKSTVHTVLIIGVGFIGCSTLLLDMIKDLGNQVLFLRSLGLRILKTFLLLQKYYKIALRLV